MLFIHISIRFPFYCYYYFIIITIFFPCSFILIQCVCSICLFQHSFFILHWFSFDCDKSNQFFSIIFWIFSTFVNARGSNIMYENIGDDDDKDAKKLRSRFIYAITLTRTFSMCIYILGFGWLGGCEWMKRLYCETSKIYFWAGRNKELKKHNRKMYFFYYSFIQIILYSYFLCASLYYSSHHHHHHIILLILNNIHDPCLYVFYLCV